MEYTMVLLEFWKGLCYQAFAFSYDTIELWNWLCNTIMLLINVQERVYLLYSNKSNTLHKKHKKYRKLLVDIFETLELVWSKKQCALQRCHAVQVS